ncbi:DUF4038 domain-containing protein [Prosthecobacter sp.]|uniref:apiosidase-like domain-containing protein n=1 Tax=Prosthecobacter sp. TaxID=1965333 RepID=UPI003784DB6F
MRLAILLSALAFTASAALPDLKVADDHRHLATADGMPFFLLGDTAWELFHRLTREEAELYLKNRADKGFNTVLAVALAEYEFDQPNAYGEMPLENNDPTKPREAYFQHVDWIVNKAESLGLYTAMLPTWGDKWNKKWGKGPEIFTPENAATYCEWLAKRYKDKPIIWILGGDRSVDNDAQRAIIRAMAAGLKKGDGGRHLITFHPKGGANSSDYWPDEPWLDFHMFQSGHAQRAKANYDMNAKNLALPALKPTLDGEPCYEDHPVRALMKDKKPTEWFDDYDVRRAAWWSVLSGACGHVYGTHSIWQFHDLTKRKAQTDARTPWQQALDLPGAAQMGVMKKFMEGLDWTKLRRDDDFLVNSHSNINPPMCAVATDGSFAVVYVPDTHTTSIAPDFSKLSFKSADMEATSMDPATGKPMGHFSFTASVFVFGAGTESKDAAGNVVSRSKDWVFLIRKKQP